MKIYTIVITYNGSKWIDKCFGNLVNSSIPLRILAIDNGSTDNTPSIIQKKFPQVEIIETKENLGFAKANNIGIKYALNHNADYVFLLNQDAWIENDTIEKLLDTFQKNKQIGIASPVHLNGSKTNLDSGFVNYISHHNTPNLISDLYFNRLNDFYETRFVNAAAWLINAKCIRKVGGFDTSLFVHYGEDSNYCPRVIYHGYKIVVNTTCSICHDRENRNEEEYRNSVWKNRNVVLSQKIWLGDINQEVDVKLRIIKTILMNILLFRYKRIDELGEDIKLIYKINRSRKINKNGGLIWFDEN
jgi:GT2 family glycosyltransferase